MSKYGDFKVVRTERRVPKQSGDPNVDADGMREYSFLKCPHCHTEDIIIASLNIERNKHPVIRDHITMCPAYVGERPVKRCKAVKLVPSNNTVSREMFEDLKRQVEEQERKMEEREQKIKEQEKKIEEKERLLASFDKLDLLRAMMTIEQENKMLKVHIKTLHASMEELEVECDEYEQDVAESWRDATERIRRIRELDAPLLRLLTPI